MLNFVTPPNLFLELCSVTDFDLFANDTAMCTTTVIPLSLKVNGPVLSPFITWHFPCTHVCSGNLLFRSSFYSLISLTLRRVTNRTLFVLTTLPNCLHVVLFNLSLRLQLMIVMTIAVMMVVAKRNRFISATGRGFVCLFFLFSVTLAISSYATLRALFYVL